MLVDFGPDIKNQLIENNIGHLDGAICTHAHFDHVAGIDDLRLFGYDNNPPFKIYSDEFTISILKDRHPHLFDTSQYYGQFLEMHPIKIYKNEIIENVEFTFINQIHGKINSLGIKSGNFLYSNDVIDFPTESEVYLYGLEHWILDCINYKSSSAHAGLEKVLEWNDKYKPKNLILTNLSHNLEYEEFKNHLPDRVVPAHDGMKIII